MEKYVTLVFDDGPNDLLVKMVDKIETYGFKAAFAIIGKKINDETQKSLKYAIDKGFELVSHGQNHLHLERLEEKEVIYELTEPIKEVEKRLGYKITLARLPFLSYNNNVFEISKQLGLGLLGMGMEGGRDWSDETTPEIISEAVVRTATDGGVACLHVRLNTLKALDVILPELKNQDFILVTPSELLKIKGIENVPLGINIDNISDFI